MALVLAITMMPVYANGTLEYLDVTGTYDVSSRAAPRYMGNTSHQTVNFGELVITTQTGKVISAATLEHMGADIALTGLVGPGLHPAIALGGTDSDGTVVAIQGRVIPDRAVPTVAASISGRIMGYVTSDGSRIVYDGNGSAAISAAYHSEPLSTLITAGTEGGAIGLQFNRPVNKLKLRNLANLTSGQLSFWFNLQSSKTPGPYFGLRFAPAGETETGLFEAVSHVDITVMPYQAYTGTGEWEECDLTPASGRCIYYGNDSTDQTAFSWEEEGGVYTLADMEALINAEAAMIAGEDSASDWVLTAIYIVLNEAGARTCYVDDVTIGGRVYTLEPNSYLSSFRVEKQP